MPTPPGLTSSLETLPGGDLVHQGLEDLHRGVESAPALLVRMFAPAVDPPSFRRSVERFLERG